MQCACILLYCHVAYPALQCFFPHLINAMIFRKKVIEHKMRVFFFISLQLLSENFSFLEELSEIWSKMYIGLHVNYPLFLSYFDDIWIFWSDFWKSTQIQNFMKILSMAAGLFDAYRRSDGHNEANSRFLQFCECAKNKWIFVSVKQDVTVAAMK